MGGCEAILIKRSSSLFSSFFDLCREANIGKWFHRKHVSHRKLTTLIRLQLSSLRYLNAALALRTWVEVLTGDKLIIGCSGKLRWNNWWRTSERTNYLWVNWDVPARARSWRWNINKTRRNIQLPRGPWKRFNLLVSIRNASADSDRGDEVAINEEKKLIIHRFDEM